MRALFPFAMSRGLSDYPICGKFVGEIRVLRTCLKPYGLSKKKMAELDALEAPGRKAKFLEDALSWYFRSFKAGSRDMAL